MGKQYDDKLVLALKRRQKVEDYHGAPVLVKYLPDCDCRELQHHPCFPPSCALTTW